MQLSQYDLLYKDNKVISMHTWILDKKSKNIIKSEENNLNIIEEITKNIEKSLKERVKGIKLINK
jgi:flagellar biosynthesis regulator FlaF